MLMTPQVLEDIVKKLNITANELRVLCAKNHLTVHIGKTEFMILSNANFVAPLPLGLQSEAISYVTENTSLGVKIDNSLSWKSYLTK